MYLERFVLLQHVFHNDRPLGNLHFIRVWHDNSGKGPNASWYLSYVVVRDVQTGVKYEFILNDWMAIEKGGLVSAISYWVMDDSRRV